MFNILFATDYTILYIHVNILLDFPKKHIKMLRDFPITMRMSTLNSQHDSFLFKNNENSYSEGISLM